MFGFEKILFTESTRQTQANTGTAGVPPAMSAQREQRVKLSVLRDHSHLSELVDDRQYWDRGRPARNERIARTTDGVECFARSLAPDGARAGETPAVPVLTLPGLRSRVNGPVLTVPVLRSRYWRW